jgi:hypothetical protein
LSGASAAAHQDGTGAYDPNRLYAHLANGLASRQSELLRQTRTISVVFALVTDPVGSGFVASFPKPGGNVTGLVTMEPTMAGKWLQERLRRDRLGEPWEPMQDTDAKPVRLPPQGLEVCEAVVNAVHRGAPGAAIAFNTRPEDSANAAARWMPHDPGHSK